jgi:hypothetical protein
VRCLCEAHNGAFGLRRQYDKEFFSCPDGRLPHYWPGNEPGDQPNTMSYSLGYASKLSFREDLGGNLGTPELRDSASTVQQGVQQLARLVSDLNSGRCCGARPRL